MSAKYWTFPDGGQKMKVPDILVDTGETCDKIGMYKKDTIVMLEITYDT